MKKTSSAWGGGPVWRYLFGSYTRTIYGCNWPIYCWASPAAAPRGRSVTHQRVA